MGRFMTSLLFFSIFFKTNKTFFSAFFRVKNFNVDVALKKII